MRGALAVLRKELLALFRSPIAYLVPAVFLVGTGCFFTYNVFLTGDATMDETFRNMGFLALVVLPMVSMRAFAQEYSARTMPLLATLPLAPWQIVAGKYLGAVCMLLLLMLGSVVNLVPLYLYGNPETSNIVAGYLGFLLFGMACLALGQFLSALTRNQIVAALATLCLLLGFWFVGNLESFQRSEALRHLVRQLSFSQHYGAFLQGLVRSDSVAFFLAVCAAALALNASFLRWQR